MDKIEMLIIGLFLSGLGLLWLIGSLLGYGITSGLYWLPIIGKFDLFSMRIKKKPSILQRINLFLRGIGLILIGGLLIMLYFSK